MAKLIHVVISSILLLALFLTLALSWDACTGRTKTKTLEEKADEAFEQYNDEDDFFESELEGDNDGTYEDDNVETDYTNQSQEEDPKVDFSEIDDKSSSTTINKLSTGNNKVNSSLEGKYLIVAGNFLVKDNAVGMVNKLQGLGYSSASYSVFDYSQYYTVVAFRSQDYSSAKRASGELKNKGIDNYVHTKR